MAERGVPGSGLSFQLVENGNILAAVFESVDNMAPIDADWVGQRLAERGFGRFFVFADALGELVRKYNAASGGFMLNIGERRDGTCSINVVPDLMAAHLTIVPPFGGEPVSREQIYEALREKGIVFGILDEKIAALVAEGDGRNTLVAVGAQPVPGEDTRFLSLVPEMRERCPQPDDSDTVDYRNLGDLISVKPCDPLMRRLPPTDGEPGRNIMGHPIPATRGNDVPFRRELNGTAFAPDDADLLIAAISGQPVLVPEGVIVEPVFTVKNVDLSSGNMNISGTLSISGDVKPGMKVKATGDIIVEGTVEAAHIEAGGDIEVKGGIIGQSEVRDGKGELSPATAFILADGSIRARFVENAYLSAANDILVQELAMKSEMNAGNRILVGEPGSSKGRIIGGICRATTQVAAVSVGSRAGINTSIEVGVDPSVQEKLTSVTRTLGIKEKELEETEKSLAFIRENPARVSPDAMKEKEKAIQRIQTEIQELAGQKRRLQKKTELADSAGIRVEHDVYSGVRVRIGGMTLLLQEDMYNTAFRMGENGITY
jgi:uncharacterized protein (DUF342 family)